MGFSIPVSNFHLIAEGGQSRQGLLVLPPHCEIYPDLFDSRFEQAKCQQTSEVDPLGSAPSIEGRYCLNL